MRTDDWGTPGWLYDYLDRIFHFDDDPCPIGGSGGLDREWGSCSFVNPPYGREEAAWVEKAVYEYFKGKTVVMLLWVKTDTKRFHELIFPNASEIIFIKGRLKYLRGGTEKKWGATFPSMIVVFRYPKEDLQFSILERKNGKITVYTSDTPLSEQVR